ncbi:eCIS core domain-containing protein [Tenacibaculum amylolyticum]|uniref:eCIS core domain-containing protein n=1 Tax=Tenacibaculum amylolyticum TaxID=104269 RepID=UPI003896647D
MHLNTDDNTRSIQTAQLKDNRTAQLKQANTQQFVDNSPKVVQQKEKGAAISNAPVQRMENKTGLPDQLKSGIESLSGMDMSDTRVHYNSSAPAQLQAHAFAQGNNIHIAPGQEQHLAHEAWHVVQQKQGRVKATKQLKGKTPVNDDAGLEREADIMGAKAMQVNDNVMEASQLKEVNTYSTPVQRVEIKFIHKEESSEEANDDALKTEVFDSKKPQEIIQWIIQNPKQINTLYSQIKLDDAIPEKERIYILNLLDRQKENILPEDVQKKLPLRSTIYGLDKAHGAKGAENVELAYQQGFRDFDAAVHYQKGKTADLFKDLKINNGIVRINYKYKFNEYRQAFMDIIALRKIKGVYIHTIMLHEIPDKKAEIEESFLDLKRMGQIFGAKIGLSNVKQIDDVDFDDNFTNLLQIAKEKEMTISSIQNRVSPSAPDERVRQIAKENEMAYMGFGLSASESDNATCSMDDSVKVEDYPILEDPIFNKHMNQLNLNDKQKQRALLEWGRQKDIKVISSSRDAIGMYHMREPYASDFLSFLDVFGSGNKEYATSYSVPAEEVELFAPFILFMQEHKIYKDFKHIQKLASNHIWRLYYKHCIVGKKDNDLIKSIQISKESEAANIIDYARKTGLNNYESITEFSEIFANYVKTGGKLHKEKASEAFAFPQTASSSQIVSMTFLNQTMKRTSSLYLDGIESATDAYVVDETTAEEKLGIVKTDSTVEIYEGHEKRATYKKVDDKKWEKM